MIRVSIGTEPMQWVAAKVLVSSIVRRTAERVEFTFSWTPERWSRHMIEGFGHGTKFNLWRWLVPKVYSYRRRVVYLDADQVVLGDIASLHDIELDGAWVAVVKNARGRFGKKRPEKGVAQTSVMVMDCEKCDWNLNRLLGMVKSGKLNGWCEKKFGRSAKHSYAALMQACWLSPSRVAELSPVWNDFNVLRSNTKLLHWSHVRDQPYSNPKHKTSYIFRQELRASIDAGHLFVDEVNAAVKSGFLHKSYAL